MNASLAVNSTHELPAIPVMMSVDAFK